MKNFLNLKWLVLPLLMVSFAVGDIAADVSHVETDSTFVQADSVSVVIAPINECENESSGMYGLLLGILGSGIAAVVLLVTYYIILRPRFEVMPIVAYKKDEKKENKLQSYFIVLRNKSWFPVCNIQIALSLGHTRLNDDHETNVFSEQSCMYMDGRWGDENKRDLQIKFEMPKGFLPKELNISLIGKHALSGNSKPTEHIFKVDDYEEGHYEKGIFIKKGLDYTQALLRMQGKKSPLLITAIMLGISLVGVIMFLVSPWDTVEKLTLLGLLILFGAISFMLYQMYYINRVKAYSSTDPKYILKAVVVHTVPQKNLLNLPNIEDVEGEDVTKKEK